MRGCNITQGEQGQPGQRCGVGLRSPAQRGAELRSAGAGLRTHVWNTEPLSLVLGCVRPLAGTLQLYTLDSQTRLHVLYSDKIFH